MLVLSGIGGGGVLLVDKAGIFSGNEEEGLSGKWKVVSEKVVVLWMREKLLEVHDDEPICR